MAIGWLTILKMVPWGDVIENAPKVATGAKKLWSRVAKKPAGATVIVAADAMPEQPLTLLQLQQQVTALQTVTAELQQQMIDSTELINTLAEQNSRLVKRVEIDRKRLLWLALCLLAMLLVLLFKPF
ncbi:MAG TPA: hypothetical protein PLB25_17130 [Rhodoferax sp.]|nr:hypothetical protein [Rhodoferax sp.]